MDHGEADEGGNGSGVAFEVAERGLASIPGIGPLIASALAANVPDASVPDVSVFHSGRQFAAWLGLVPRQHSSGCKQRLGGITKAGDLYLRRLLARIAWAIQAPRRALSPAGRGRGQHC